MITYPTALTGIVEAELDDLTCSWCGRECATARGLSVHRHHCPERPAPAVLTALVGCPVCGHPCRPGSLAKHLAEQHPGHEAPLPAAPAPATFLDLLAGESPFFRCPQCRSDAFAESLSHPGMCVRCARAQSSEAA